MNDLPDPTAAPAGVGAGAWVVLPTFNERENLAAISAAILEALPGATLLVVDDSSPDGTGDIAEELAAADAPDPRQAPPGQAGPGTRVPRRVRRGAHRRRDRS